MKDAMWMTDSAASKMQKENLRSRSIPCQTSRTTRMMPLCDEGTTRSGRERDTSIICQYPKICIYPTSTPR
jgi:hypothetical protein